MTLESLPVELYYAIIEQIEPALVKPTLLALTRALPHAPVPTEALFTSVNIYSTETALRLYSRLRKITANADGSAKITVDPVAHAVKEFYIECWDVDADTIVNLVTLLKGIRILVIRIGPRNFAPEHLEELVLALRRDMRHLEHIVFRFRPYVEKATYLPFLKVSQSFTSGKMLIPNANRLTQLSKLTRLQGSYFDTTLIALSGWSFAALKTVSIIQDPLDSCIVHIPAGHSFAQPIVFFRLDHPLSTLLSCPRVASICFRLPSRQLSRAFTHDIKRTFGHVRSLDLSTANITEVDVDKILSRFSQLENLILDGCKTLSSSLGNAHIPETQVNWFAFGRQAALSGSRRAREYERMINRMLAEVHAQNQHSNIAKKQEPKEPKVKKGRRGLATATISFKEKEPPPSTSLRSGPSTSSQSHRPSQVLPEKIRVLPPVPSIKALAITIADPRTADVIAAFSSGWKEGLEVLANQRRVILTAFRNRLHLEVNPVWTVKFDDGATTWESLDGYVNVTVSDLEDEDRIWDRCSVPLLCFVGEEPEGHPEGCCHLKEERRFIRL